MARAPSACKTPQCPEFTPCPTHKPKPWQRNNPRKLPTNWPTIRKRIKTRDKYQCTIPGCATPRHKLEVDHIGDNNNHDDNNLRTLCSNHHLTRSLQQATEAKRNTEQLT